MLCYNMRMKGNSGFTLLELLTVIAIMIILAGILVPTVGMVRQKAKAARAQADIESLCVALKMYEADFGVFPNIDQDNDANGFKALLGNELTGPGGVGKVGPYMEFKIKDMKTPTSTIFCDP